MMPEFYLYLVTCKNITEAKSEQLVSVLGTIGDVAPALAGTVWLLSVKAEQADEMELDAGNLLERLIDELGDDLECVLVEVDNIATFNISEDGDGLLDKLFPLDEEEE